MSQTITCAQVMQKEGVLAFTTIEEGDITATRLAQLPDDVDAERVKFLQVCHAFKTCRDTWSAVSIA